MPATNPFAYSTLNTGGRDALLTEKIKHAIQLRRVKAATKTNAPAREYKKRNSLRASIGGQYEATADDVNGGMQHSAMPPISGGAITSRRSKTLSKQRRVHKSRRSKTENPDITHLFHGAVRRAAKMHAEASRRRKSGQQVYRDEQQHYDESVDGPYEVIDDEYTGQLNDHYELHNHHTSDIWNHARDQPYSLEAAADSMQISYADVARAHELDEDEDVQSSWHQEEPHAADNPYKQYHHQPQAPSGAPPPKSFHRSNHYTLNHRKPTKIHPPSKYSSNMALNLLKKEIVYESKRRPSTTSHKLRANRKRSPRITNLLTGRPRKASQYVDAPAVSKSQKRRNSLSVPPSDESVEELPSTLSQAQPLAGDAIRIVVNFCIVRPPSGNANDDSSETLTSFQVSGVTVTEDDNFEVLVVNRRILNQATYHALPGAPLQFMQSPEEAVFKFMGQYVSNFEPSLKPILPLHLITVAANPERDPVGHVISHVYALKTELGTEGEENANTQDNDEDDVETHSAFEFVPINRLLQGKDYVLALDHKGLLLQFLLWYRAYGKDLLL
eukprot:CAMPEP_0117436278 /NCGR_PEP_ID=MMETSP0759-20121206/923_1 /TAXON_ID=63605 /ORGANISM="Percolomonas cosmopolitus, Strain WS" /LENGTH=556 /DNA_ID=CAMNT_0005227869 /DNA_START=115 /DNA_END=1785 /DNA_ORIENTATION=-